MLVHGVLITFRRPDALANFLSVLTTQTVSLASLVVVDNDDDEEVAGLVADFDLGTTEVYYVGCSENMGPAGGIDAGLEHVFRRAEDDHWVVLLDDDDPPLRPSSLEALRRVATSRSMRDQRCAAVGMWGARLDRRSGRVRSVGGEKPVQVDYLPGSALPHYRVGPVRMVGPPPPEFFFGFDDLELGLRLVDAGWTLYSSGLARAHGVGHMIEGRRVSLRVEEASWRRYYSLRNGIVVLRGHEAIVGALWRTAVAGLAKPLLNLPRAPRSAWANLLLNLRAIHDGWRGHLGKTLDPVGRPIPKRNAAPPGFG